MVFKHLSVFAVVVCGALNAAATAYTWTGASDAYWTNKANWKVGSAVATAVPGSAAGDSVTFPDLSSTETVVINLDGMTKIKRVTIDAGATPYQLGLESSTAQSLCLESGATVVMSSTVTAIQWVKAFRTIAGGNVSVWNNSTSAKLVFGNLYKTGNNPTYSFFGAGDIEMDGATSFDQVSYCYLYNTGNFILGDKSISTGSRISMFYSMPTNTLSGYRQVEIPAGRYMNTTGGGWNSITFEAQTDTRIYGEGIVVARYHFNCNTKASQEYSANFAVSAGKTLKVESYIRMRSGDMAPWGGPGVFGVGTLYLTCSNNLPGQARIQETGTLACDKIGLKGCKADESNLGMGDAIRYMNSGTLEYRGTSGETTDRDLIVSNNNMVVTMTLANGGQGNLVWTGTAKQMYSAEESMGARLRLYAKTAPVYCNGNFEEGKSWAITVSGYQGVYLMKDYGVNIPIRMNSGKLMLSNTVACNSPILVDADSTLEVAADSQLELATIPAIVTGGQTLNIVVPEGSSLTFPGKGNLRLDGITINGSAAKTDANGKLVKDETEYGTSTWTSVTSGGYWLTESNWLDNRIPNAFDNVIVANTDSALSTYTITVNTPAKLSKLTAQTTQAGAQTLSGAGPLTIGGNGYIAITNTTVTRGHNNYDGGPFNFQVPLHLSASQRWLLGSARGWGAAHGESLRYIENDLSSEQDIEWSIYGFARYRFTGGNSTNFQGTVKLGSFVQFNGTNQFHRLGTKGVTLVCRKLTDDEAKNAGTTLMSPGLTYIFNSGETNATVTTPIGLDLARQVWDSRSGWCQVDAPICMCAPTLATCGEPYALTLSGGFSGSSSDSHMRLSFIQSYETMCPYGTYCYNFYPEDQKIILAGDSRALSSTAVRNYTMIEIAHPHALGANNKVAVSCGYDGYWNTQAYNTILGVSLMAGESMSGEIAAAGSSDANGSKNRIAYMQVGSSPARNNSGAKTATFKGNVSEAAGNGFRLRLYAAKGTEARFTGKITTKLPLSHPYGEHPDIIGLGDVTLVNAENSFATNVCVRSGRLVLEANGAAGTKPIWLGGFVPTLTETKEVRCVNANYDFNYSIANITEGGVTKYGKRITVTNASVPEIDGVTVQSGDYVIVARPRNWAINGLWKVTSDVKVWERPEELDEADDMIGKVGLRLKVKEGKRFGGKAFMLSRNPLYYRKSEQFNVEGERFNSGDGVPIFHPEAAANPDVAVLTGKDSLVLTCGIDVTDNASTGASIIGSKIENSTTGFSGPITLAKSVTLAAAAGSTVNFTGTISGTGDIIGGGAGVSDISAATLSTAAANGFQLAGGTLKVANAQLGSRPISWKRKVGEGGEDSTGALSVTGDLDLSARTVAFDNFNLSLSAGDDVLSARKWTLATATGAITLPTNPPTMPRRWSLVKEGGTLYAKYTPAGAVLLIR